MAIDGPTAPPCDPEIFYNGQVVLVTHTIPSNAMERWVKQVAELSGQRVDWSFFGGRAVVRALGDLERVKAAIQQLMPEHDHLQREACKRLEY